MTQISGSATDGNSGDGNMNFAPLLRTLAKGATVTLGGIFSITMISSTAMTLFTLAKKDQFGSSSSSSIKNKNASSCGVCREKGFYMCKLCKGNATIQWSPLYDPVFINPCLCPTCDGQRIQRCLNCLGSGFVQHAKVYGMEYGFGAHDYSISGVFEVEPRSCPGFIYRCSMSLGHINMSASEFREFIETMASDYHGDTYHLISKNCNHFTDDISQRLNCKRIPGWVNRLAKLGALFSCLLPDSLEATTIKQLPEYHTYEDEGSDSGSNSSSQEASESDEVDQKVLLSPTPAAEISIIKEIPR